jgi:hypothetical protein
MRLNKITAYKFVSEMSQRPSNLAYRILVGKTEGKKPLRRPRHRCVKNILNGF